MRDTKEPKKRGERTSAASPDHEAARLFGEPVELRNLEFDEK